MPETEKMQGIALVVACALIDPNGLVLLQKRPQGKPMAGLWEFPGGKVEAGEIPEAALMRELREELSVEVSNPAPAVFASAPLDDRHLLLLLYICREWAGPIVPAQGQPLQWASIGSMRDLPMPPADYPLIDLLEQML